MLVIVCPSPAERDRFAEQLITNRASLLSLGKVRALLAGRVSEEEIDAPRAGGARRRDPEAPRRRTRPS